jgi:hypothetical protein
VVPQIVKAQLGNIAREREAARHGLREQSQGASRGDLQSR